MDPSPLASAAACLLEGDTASARALCLGVLDQQDENAEAHHLLGLALAKNGDSGAAEDALTRAVAMEPHRAAWRRDLGVVCAARKDWRHASEHFRTAHELAPENLTYLRLYARALLRLQQLSPRPDSPCAASVARTLLARDPQSDTGHKLLIDALERLTRFGERLTAALEFAAHYPDSFDALDRLCNAHWEMGDLNACLDVFDRMMDLGVATSATLDFRLSVLLHHAAQTPASLLAAHRDWAARFCPAPSPPEPFSNDLHMDRVLRIGYIGGEFKCCPTFHFLYPILRQHDRERFQIFGYRSNPAEDNCARAFRDLGDQWHDVSALSDEDLCALIRAHRIDVLIDCSGHYPWHRLTALARRAAPVQVIYPNYPATTGVPSVDYVLTDRWACPPGLESNYSEQVYRVPSGYLVYGGPGELEIPPLPGLSNGFVTFGVFQRPGKWNVRSWDLAGAVLNAVPNSILLFQFGSADLEDPGSRLRSNFTAELVSRGVSPDRLRFQGSVPFRERVRLQGEIDIALDTFPYNGQTTTCESLWMGCPVITLAGESHVSRVAASILHQVDLGDWVAASAGEYVAIAVRAASDLPALARLRAAMRSRLTGSSLLDARAKAREFECAYRTMFERWAAGQTRAHVSASAS